MGGSVKNSFARTKILDKGVPRGIYFNAGILRRGARNCGGWI